MTYKDLQKKRKAERKAKWKSIGIKFSNEEFEYIWGVFENINECMLCCKDFKNSYDKCLDHNHETGEPRYILCRACNVGYDTKVKSTNRLGEKYISQRTIKKVDCWLIVSPKYKIYKAFSKNKWSLEQVIEKRNELFNS
jgi:hypothetical protein